MQKDGSSSSRRFDLARRLAFLAVLAVWVLLVLRDQYKVSSLLPFEGLDLVFLGALAALWLVVRAQLRSVSEAAGLALRIALLLTVIVVSLFAGEHALRYAFRNVHSSADNHDWVSLYNHGQEARLNSLDCRDPEFPPRGDRYRIAVVGDSLTFGFGIEEKDRLTNRLQASLGPRFEVLNFGFPGNNLPDHREILDRALTVQPDFVLLQLFPNDWELPKMTRPTGIPLLPPYGHRYFREHSLTYNILSRGWMRFQELIGIGESYDHYLARYVGNPQSPESTATTALLRGLFNRGREAHVGMGAVMFPFVDMMGPGGKYPLLFIHQRMLEACAAEQVTCVDLYNDFAKVRDLRTLRVSPLDGHPSALANARATAVVLGTFGAAWDH